MNFAMGFEEEGGCFLAVRRLNPEIRDGDRRLILATRLIAAVRRSALRRAGSAAAQRDDITRAAGILMGGV